MTTEKQALLFVETEPGSHVSVEDFHEWYDTEHVPLRLGFPEILTATRYKSLTAPYRPGWLATYSIADKAVFESEKYTGLRTNRSKREGELIRRIGILDRRIYLTKEESSPVVPSQSAEIVVAFETGSEEVAKSHFQLAKDEFKGDSQWIRSTLYDLTDGSIVGLDKQEVAPAQRFLVLHQFRGQDYQQSEIFKNIAGKGILKEWGLYRNWETR